MKKIKNDSTIFETSHSEFTSSDPKSIWKLWIDVDNWPKWDSGLISSKLLSKFEKGKTILLTPHGSPEPIKLKLLDVEFQKSFSDIAELPFGTIKTRHMLEKIKKNQYQITHSIIADIESEHVEFFENEIWSHMQDGLPNAVRQLVKISENIET